MHDKKSVDACSQVVDYDTGAFGKPLKPANRKRFQDIVDTEKYKAGQKGFPSERDADEGDELSGNFVDDDELRVFYTSGA